MTKAKVLVVDDEEDIRNLAGIMLRDAEYEVILGADGEEAVKLAKSNEPNLIFMDVVMPNKGGFEACSEIKSDPSTKGIPIVMFSALGRDVDKKMATEAGADGYLTKPFTSEELLKAVETNLNAAMKNKFSTLLDTTHEKLQGKKILCEFDPTAQYDEFLRDFAIEARENGKSVLILTRKGSSIENIIKKEKEIDVLELTPDTKLSIVIEKYEGKDLALIYDNLTDLMISDGVKVAYSAAKGMLDLLSEDRFTSIFLLNPDAHSSSDASSIKSLFASHIRCSKQGLEKQRLA